MGGCSSYVIIILQTEETFKPFPEKLRVFKVLEGLVFLGSFVRVLHVGLS